eukprot:4604312-Amphidinium_carterae.1
MNDRRARAFDEDPECVFCKEGFGTPHHVVFEGCWGPERSISNNASSFVLSLGSFLLKSGGGSTSSRNASTQKLLECHWAWHYL